MGERSRARTFGLVALCVLALAGVAIALLTSGGAPSSPGVVGVRLIEGVPVGVEDTRAGALAAADNYVALASQSVEQDPTEFARLVSLVFLPGERKAVLEQAQGLRGADPSGMANYREGGRALAVIAARRIDSFTPTRASVTSWLGGFEWGPRTEPRQSWNLIDTTLDWHSGRWMVASSETEGTPAPVPAIVYVRGANDRSSAFAELAGMAAPFYGTAGG